MLILYDEPRISALEIPGLIIAWFNTLKGLEMLRSDRRKNLLFNPDSGKLSLHKIPVVSRGYSASDKR